MQSRLYVISIMLIVDWCGITRQFRNQTSTSEAHARWLAERNEPDGIYVSHTFWEQS